MKSELSVVVPVRNAEKELRSIYQCLQETMQRSACTYMLIFVDDGSEDKTAGELERLAQEQPQVRSVHLSRFFGQEAAIQAGLDASQGEAVIVVDATIQSEPELLLKMTAKWREGYDIVYCRQPKGGFQYVLLGRKSVDAIRAMPERNRQFSHMVSWIGFRHADIVPRSKRRGPPRGCKEALTRGLFYSTRPIAWIAFLGVALGVCGGIWLLVLLFITLAGGSISSLQFISALCVFLSGAIIGCIGILGAYLGRIYDEVRNRPLYIIDRRYGFDDHGSDDPQ